MQTLVRTARMRTSGDLQQAPCLLHLTGENSLGLSGKHILLMWVKH